MSRKHFYMAAALFASSQTAFSGVNDYQLISLPDTVGNQSIDAVGDINQLTPTSISNSGLMAGSAITWTGTEVATPLGGTRFVADINRQASYIYDLESQSFLANPIVGMAITYISDDIYLGKTLTEDRQSWQTWRCPISGLIHKRGLNEWANPRCKLIDDDYLNENAATGDWDGFFILGTYFRAIANAYASNEAGSTVVLDIADDFPGNSGEPDKYIYYKADGLSIGTDGAAANPDWDIAGQLLSSAKIAMFRREAGSDVFYFLADPSFSQENGTAIPGAVYRVEIPDNSLTPSVTSENIEWIDPATGQYVTPLMVNLDGDVLTSSGICHMNTAPECQVRTEIVEASSLPRTLPSTSATFQHYFDSEVIIAPHCIRGPTGSETCEPDVLFFDIATGEIMSMVDTIYNQTAAVVDLPGFAYGFPGFFDVTAAQAPARTIVSRNGKYFMLTTLDSNGDHKNYVMKRSY